VGPLTVVAIAGAGLAAGTINTVVGSGTLITFPTLLAFGYSPLVANVSNTVGLVPGSLSGVYAYRRELSDDDQHQRALRLGIFSVLGSVVGSLLLLELPSTAFRRVIPFLILLACALVAVQPTASRWLARTEVRSANNEEAKRVLGRRGRLLFAAVFATGIYGGYFGAAQGVILISLLAIFVGDHLQRLNAIKNVLTLLANLVAGVIFIISGHVSWEVAGVLAVGAIAGGQVGGRLGRRLPQPVLRAAIVVVGTTVAVLLLV
jgi:hypothetical protein